MHAPSLNGTAGPGTRPHRILFAETNEDGTVGGSHKALIDLVTRLDRTRFEPVVLFYQENRYFPTLRAAGIETLSLDVDRTRERRIYATRGIAGRAVEMINVVRRRAALLRRHRIDLVHVINSPRVTCDDWMPAAKLTRIPCVSSEMLLDSSVTIGPARRWLVRRFDRILPVSGHQERMVRSWGVAPERIVKIHHGIDAGELRAALTRPRDDVRRELGVAPGLALVAMVGNLRHWKGQHLVVEALRRIPEPVRRGVRMVFAGSGDPKDPSYEQGLRDAVEAMGMTDRVAFLGFRSDAPAILNAADIAVHASVEPEPGGIVVMEAMALGTAVVASRIGGQAELISPETGVTFDPKDPDDLARQLAALLRDPERRARMGEAASLRMDAFSSARNAEEHEVVYASLLAG